MIVSNIKNFEKNFDNFIESCLTLDEKITVTTDKGNIVIISEKEYENLLESLYLAQIPGMYKSIQEGINETSDEFVEVIFD